MNKTKHFFYALLAGFLTLVLLIVGLMPCQAAHTAHAQEDAMWDSIYYFSDSSMEDSFCPPFLSGYHVEE